ncbi:NMDAR2-C domain containing protein [Pyrenophora tritici-repentis]|uniref:NMDAR2-C domain containing protein n=1 Tax=Pyrenophora tritici-repentis TaxID=45151 RepID=A0A834VLZ5_9PLEO|nr:NMDAR2-C domain containing protein [Pyrenophora tritici-repentis]
MPPDSDNIIVQIPEASGNSTNTAIYLENDIQMGIEEDQTPATPTQTQPNPPERLVPIMNKRPALFSPVYDRTAEMSTSKSSWLDSYRLQITDNIEARAQWHVPENGLTGRNPFQKNDSDKPTAKDPEQAIQWARNLILQASIMINSYEEQNKLLELLDVFRDYTEKGRVTNQISDKLSAKLAFHSATLANASEKAAKTLKKATATVAGQNNQTVAVATTTTNTNAPQSYATIAAQPSKNATWTTVAPKKKPTPKKLITHYQIVATLEENQTINPLQARNKINEAFQKAGIAGPVIQLAALSKRNNLILTTTSGYSGEFLLQQSNIWMDLFNIKHAQPLESWTKVIVHNVPTTFEGADTLEILQTEIPTYNKGLQIVGNSYWLTKDWKNKQNSSIVIAFKTEAEAKKLGARIIILGESLRTEKYRT